MKNKIVVMLIILALITALMIIDLVTDQNNIKNFESSKEIVNKITTANEIASTSEEIKEETTDIQEDIISESEIETIPEADIKQPEEVEIKEAALIISKSTEEKQKVITKEPEQETVDKPITKVTTESKKDTQVQEQKQEEIVQEPVKEENIADTKTELKKQEVKTPKCTDTEHGIGAGNSNQWFDTKNQAIAIYDSEIQEWSDKWINDEISDEEYYNGCPDGYEVWSCPYCGKWTINYYY